MALLALHGLKLMKSSLCECWILWKVGSHEMPYSSDFLECRWILNRETKIRCSKLNGNWWRHCCLLLVDLWFCESSEIICRSKSSSSKELLAFKPSPSFCAIFDQGGQGQKITLLWQRPSYKPFMLILHTTYLHLREFARSFLNSKSLRRTSG